MLYILKTDRVGYKYTWRFSGLICVFQSDVRWVVCTQALGLKPEGSVLFFTHALLLRTKPLTCARDPQGQAAWRRAVPHRHTILLCSSAQIRAWVCLRAGQQGISWKSLPIAQISALFEFIEGLGSL